MLKSVLHFTWEGRVISEITKECYYKEFFSAKRVVILFIMKQPSNMKPTPTPTGILLVLTLYRLAHGCSFPIVDALFAVSESLASIYV